MAKARKDLRGRALKKGEIQRKDDQRYMYTYTDPLGRRKFIYANDLTELREKEQISLMVWIYMPQAKQPSMIHLIATCQQSLICETRREADICTHTTVG